MRHLFAPEVRKGVHGLEAVQVLLGHSRADVTQVYAERDLAPASSVGAKHVALDGLTVQALGLGNLLSPLDKGAGHLAAGQIKAQAAAQQGETSS